MSSKSGIQQPENKSRKKPASRQQRDKLSGAQVMFAAILAIGLILAINFSTRLAASRPLNEYYKGVETELEHLKLVQATLIADRDFAQSDAFVAQWARSSGKMIRPGEILVVPLPVGQPAAPIEQPRIFVQQETTRPEPENWRLWWSLFFDSDPPGF
jgi:hypothetical protein